MDPARAEPEDIFCDALELAAPEERAAYLERACGGDASLRRRVERLLEAHDQADSFLDAGPTVEAATTEPGAVAGGAVIGPYRLLQQIGEGGMGTVWMAQQQEPVKRLVAVKLIKAGMDSRQVIARFEAERQALALMDHANIARVLDAGTTKGEPGGVSPGRPYFVMDLVRGVPITRYCDEYHLTPRQRLELFLPVCEAVQHAHQKGIIHRDLKPSNVLVALYDGKPVPKVIDFGVAKAAGQSLTEKTLVTGFGHIVGTLEYMSPEQADLNNQDIDTRSDIYSLGVLLYELLTGSPPFTRKEFEQAGMLEMLRVIRELEPTTPSTKLSRSEGLPTLAAHRGEDPAKLTRLVRGELDWIAMKALEKDRNRRYATANDFAQDVQRYLADEPVLACPPSAGYRLRKFARRNKGRLAVATGVFLAVMVMAASIGWAVGDRSARLRTVEGHVRASLNMAREYCAQDNVPAAREKVAQARAQLGNDGPALGDLAAEVAAAEADLDRLEKFLDRIDRARQAETAPLLEPAGMAQSSGGAATPASAKAGERRPAAVVPFLLEALQLHDILGRDGWDSSLEGGLLGKQQVEQIRRLAYESLYWLAEDVLRRKREHRSGQEISPEGASRQALVYLGKAESAWRPTRAFYALRSDCRKALGEEGAAQADRQRAASTPATMALDHAVRGREAWEAKQLANGVRAFEAALRLEPTDYWSLMWLGHCLSDRGQGPEDFARAALVYSGCIAKRPDHAHAYFCRANVYSKLGRHEDAVADSSRALELEPQHAKACFIRGAAYANGGQKEKAIPDFSRAIELEPDFLFAWYNRGTAYSQLGRLEQAVADLTRAIEIDETYTPAWINRGKACIDLNQANQATADLSRATELEPKNAAAWYMRGRAHFKFGQPAQAVTDYSRAIDLDPGDWQTWDARGLAHASLNQLREAVADHSRAIELNPKHASPWNNRGVAYYKLGRTAEAIADYSRAIELKPDMLSAWNNRGHAHRKLGRQEAVVADFSRVIELNPANVQAWNNRGSGYHALGQLEKALADYSRAVELNPEYALAWWNRGRIHTLLGRPKQAIADCSRAVELAPKEGGYWNYLGVAHYCAGDPKAAVAAFDRAFVLRRNRGAVELLVLAMAQQKLGNPGEARKAYEQAVRWLEENKQAVEQDREYAAEVRRFRAEAEEVLELKKH